MATQAKSASGFPDTDLLVTVNSTLNTTYTVAAPIKQIFQGSNVYASNYYIPFTLTAVAGNGQATISFTPVTGASSYNLYYSTTFPVTTSSTKVTGVLSSGTVQSGLTNGTTYYFAVTTVTGMIESRLSSQVSATPSAAAHSRQVRRMTILSISQRHWAPPSHGTIGPASTTQVITSIASASWCEAGVPFRSLT